VCQFLRLERYFVIVTILVELRICITGIVTNPRLVVSHAPMMASNDANRPKHSSNIVLRIFRGLVLETPHGLGMRLCLDGRRSGQNPAFQLNAPGFDVMREPVGSDVG
jgi:hypothetical protein